MKDHTNEVADEDGTNVRLVSCRIKRWRFRCEEYKLDDGTKNKQRDRAAIEAKMSA